VDQPGIDSHTDGRTVWLFGHSGSRSIFPHMPCNVEALGIAWVGSQVSCFQPRDVNYVTGAVMEDELRKRDDADEGARCRSQQKCGYCYVHAL
jgi:hypothetical protein